MKKKTAITILSVVVSLIIVISVTTAVYAKKIRNLEPGRESSEYFADKSVSQLIIDLNFFNQFDNLNGDLYFSLYDKIDEDDAEYCSNIIKSPFYSNVAKIALLDICMEKEISLDKNTLGKMITKKSVDSDLRSYIIGYCSYQDNEYLEEIKSVASDFDDELSYYALFRLNFLDSADAEKIAKKVIDEYDGDCSDLIQNAIMIEEERSSKTEDNKVQ